MEGVYWPGCVKTAKEEEGSIVTRLSITVIEVKAEAKNECIKKKEAKWAETDPIF